MVYNTWLKMIMESRSTKPLVKIMGKVKATFGIVILFGALFGATAVNVSAQTGNSRIYMNGCVIREWENERNPQYRESNPGRCLSLDRSLDGGDGPNRGRVRGNFQSSPSATIKKRSRN